MLRLAIKEAARSSARCQHGAVICRKQSVLGIGHNTYKTHATRGRGPLKTLHAEASAIRDAIRRGIDLRGTTIYVARVGGGSQLSKPCQYCQIMIEEAGVRKVIYTDENGKTITEWPL